MTVSVVIPVYNQAPYLSECLDSVLAQTLRESEIVCVDDGSTDGSSRILDEYAARDARVKVIHQENHGVGPARNTGMDAAQGEFIAFMDPDDKYPDDGVLADLVRGAEENGVDVCGGSMVAMDGRNLETAFTFSQDGLTAFADYQFEFGFYRYVYRSRLLKEKNVRFPALVRFQDVPFFVEAMHAAGRFFALARPVYCLRMGHHGIDWVANGCAKGRDNAQGLAMVYDMARRYGYERMADRVMGRLTEFVGWLGGDICRLRDTEGRQADEISRQADEIRRQANEIADLREVRSYLQSLALACPTCRAKGPVRKLDVKLSIIVPIYGVECYLRQCLDSIVGQSFAAFEVILVDDGGRDGCPRICDEYAAMDGRFRVIHKENAGYGAAVNSGLDAARGDWIGIVEPDDWLASSMYGALMARAADGVDIVKGNFLYIHPWGIRRRGIGLPLPAEPFPISDHPLLLTLHPSIWTCIYRRSFLVENGIRMKEIPGAGWADNPFLIETMCRARRVSFVDNVGYFYRSPFTDPVIKRAQWQVPYGRMMDIFDWVESNGVSDAGIMDAVYQRVLYCAAMMAQMKKNVRAEIVPAIAKVLARIDEGRLNASGILTKSTISKYRIMKKHPLLSVVVIRLYMLTKKLKMYLQLPSERRRQEEG